MADTPPAPADRVLARVAAVAGQVLVPLGAVTGVLYYFGYVRERALYSYFGVPLGSLDLTTTDYVLRSTQAIFTPLAALLVVTLVAVLVHQLVLRQSAGRYPTLWRRGTIATAAVALLLLGVGVAALARPRPLEPVAGALSLGAGASLLVVTLVAVLVHQLVLRQSAGRYPTLWRRGTIATAAVALLLLGVGVAALARLRPLGPVAGALSLGAGASLLVVTLVAVLVHQLVLRQSAGRYPTLWRRGTIATAAVALLLLGVGVAALARLRPLEPVAGALSLGAGAALLEYAVWMTAAGQWVPEPVAQALHHGRFLRGGVLAAVVLLALFWWTANVANTNGLATARAVELSLVIQTEAVVLSDEPLAVAGYGVEIERLPGGAGFQYRHTGLRVLAHTGERWVLLPVGWRPNNGAVAVLLPEDIEGVRVDIRP